MIDEQIRQKAEEYADSMIEIRGELEWCSTRDDFIVGAHSRDKEIEELRRLLFEKECDIQFLEHKLRNPWISVEERLPEKTRNLSPFPDEYDEKVVLVINKVVKD